VCVRYFLPYRLRGIRRGNKKISPRTIRNNNSLVQHYDIIIIYINTVRSGSGRRYKRTARYYY
jgi:hypothetical protein